MNIQRCLYVDAYVCMYVLPAVGMHIHSINLCVPLTALGARRCPVWGQEGQATSGLGGAWPTPLLHFQSAPQSGDKRIRTP